MRKKTPGPTKKDLITVLKQHERHESPKILALRERHIEAEHAFQAWCKANKTYQRLRTRVERLRSQLYRASEKERTTSKQARQECYNAIHLHGPTPAVVRKIQAFLRKYP